jgi:hypothetical protein
MAAQQRAVAKAATKAEEMLPRVQARFDNLDNESAKRRPGRPAKATPCLEQIGQEGEAARHEHPRLSAQRAQVLQSIRAIGQAYHFVDVERGVRRNGKLIAGDIQQHIDTIRTIAQQEHLSETCMDRLEKAQRGVPKMQATVECVSGYVRQQVNRLELAPPPSFALQAPLIPSYSLDRVAQRRTVTEGEPLRELAERRRAPLCEPGGTFGQLSAEAQAQLHQRAQTLAAVFQRSSSNVEGRNGYLSLRNHQLRGLDLPRTRECLTAIHNFFLTRPDGTTAAARFFGQKPRSMFATIWASVELAPAPLHPPRKS